MYIFNSTNKFFYTATFYKFWYLNHHPTLDRDANFAFDTHSSHFARHRVKFQTQRSILYFQLIFRIFVYASVIIARARQKKPLWEWEMATYRPPPPALSLGNKRLSPQAKILLALLKRKAFN